MCYIDNCFNFYFQDRFRTGLTDPPDICTVSIHFVFVDLLGICRGFLSWGGAGDCESPSSRLLPSLFVIPMDSKHRICRGEGQKVGHWAGVYFRFVLPCDIRIMDPEDCEFLYVYAFSCESEMHVCEIISFCFEMQCVGMFPSFFTACQLSCHS